MTRRVPRGTRLTGIAALLALVGAGCAKNAPQDYLRPEGPIAIDADRLFRPVFWIAVGVFVVVEGLLVWALFRYRHRRGRRVAPVQTHGNTVLEIGWTAVPTIILIVVGVLTVLAIVKVSARPTGNVLRVDISANQWWWEYSYPQEKVVTANELHIPVGRPVYLRMTSTDVIHSFWVPKLAGKQDVIPGRTTFLTIEASKPGEYIGQCAEFCGLSHANMRLRVFAHTATDFASWVDDQRAPAMTPTDAQAAEGSRIFQAGQCIGCHTVAGTSAQGKIGPDLTHFASRTTFAGAMSELNEDNLARWLRDPPAFKPGAKMPNLNLSEDDIDRLVAYLMSLE